MTNPVKTIITHLNPDLDALCSVWLLKRFLAGWEEAEVKFVPAGIVPVRSEEKGVSSKDNNTLYVDTGFGKLDHHQTGEKTCAAKLTWQYIKDKMSRHSGEPLDFARDKLCDSRIKNGFWTSLSTSSSRPRGQNDEEKKIGLQAIDRLVEVVLRIDFDAQDITIAKASDDFYSFLFNERQIIRGLRTLYRGQSEKHLEIGLVILDAVFEVLKAKIEAEKIIQNGVKFKTRWGKAVGALTNNEMYMHLAQENGFKVVVSKDPKKGHVRIHALPNRRIDFTDAYNKLKALDPKATWFLHASKSLLLNGSSANPDMKPTKLSLEEVIEVLKNH